MSRTKQLLRLTCCALLLCACSQRDERTTTSTPTDASSQASDERASNRHGGTALRANGIASEYIAHFEDGHIARIDEHRQTESGSMLTSEYTYRGARLIRYRGAKLTQPAMLDLQFDVQGMLQSGGGADVTDEDIAAIRNRAQLIRSHALARRSASEHTRGH